MKETVDYSMDTKIKLWEVYDRQRVVRTYSGHKLPVREVAFNNEGTEFLSASFDRYVNTGQINGSLECGIDLHFFVKKLLFSHYFPLFF